MERDLMLKGTLFRIRSWNHEKKRSHFELRTWNNVEENILVLGILAEKKVILNAVREQGGIRNTCICETRYNVKKSRIFSLTVPWHGGRDPCTPCGKCDRLKSRPGGPYKLWYYLIIILHTMIFNVGTYWEIWNGKVSSRFNLLQYLLQFHSNLLHWFLL